MEKTTKKQSFLGGAATIALGGFIAKLIGAIYRIPLTNLIGGHGLGLYQLVYPVYCLLLTVSATGIPASIAKLTAERLGKGESAKPLLKTALKLFLLIGIFATLLMVALAPMLSAAQGEKGLFWGYLALAPSVFLVSVLSVFRGWFQGRNRMSPTALSEIIEQAVKVGFGLLFAYIFRANTLKAVTFLLLAVSLSETVALLIMLWLYKRAKREEKTENDGGRVAMKSILALSIPVTLNSALLPLSGLLDSVLAVRLLGRYAVDPVALYGLFSGGAVTVISLPVSICYGIAAASVPALAGAAASLGKSGKEKRRTMKKKLFFSLGITLLVSLPSAVGLYLFASPAVKIIFRSLKGEELDILIRLVKIFSVSAVTLSCVQTLSACLTAQGRPRFAAVSMLIGVTVKTVLYIFLLKNSEISVFGMAHATNACYLVAFFLDLLYNLYTIKRTDARRKRV